MSKRLDLDTASVRSTAGTANRGERRRSTGRRAGPLLLLPLALAACASAAEQPAHAAGAHDAGFAEMQTRGATAMGVDQYTSTHLFDDLDDGGRIELQRDVEDPAGIATIRAHLKEIAVSFAKGDFKTPAFVHGRDDVPGTAVMAAKHTAITYTYRDLPRGGEVRIVTQDAEALHAIHQFLAFQRSDHQAGGRSHH